MMIELRSWGINVEVQLIDDDGYLTDRFYVLNKDIVIDAPGVGSEFLFHTMETVLSPPAIGGIFAAHNPYWSERKMRREWRARKLGLK